MGTAAKDLRQFFISCSLSIIRVSLYIHVASLKSLFFGAILSLSELPFSPSKLPAYVTVVGYPFILLFSYILYAGH